MEESLNSNEFSYISFSDFKSLDIEFIRNILKIKVAFARTNQRFGFISQKDLQNIENAVDILMLDLNDKNVKTFSESFNSSAPVKAIDEEVNSVILQIINKTSFADITNSEFISKNQNEDRIIFSAFRITAALYYFSDIKQNINKIASKMTNSNKGDQLVRLIKLANSSVENLYFLSFFNKENVEEFKNRNQILEFEEQLSKELFSMVILPIETVEHFDYNNLLIDMSLFNSIIFSYAFYFNNIISDSNFQNIQDLDNIKENIKTIFANTKKINNLITDVDEFSVYNRNSLFFIFSVILNNVKQFAQISTTLLGE